MSLFSKKDIVQGKDQPGWGSLVFAVFIFWVLVDCYFTKASALEWTLTSLGVVLFLVLFGLAVRYWNRNSRIVWMGVVGVTLLGILFMPFNNSGVVFFIYAGSIVPFAVRGNIRETLWLLGALTLIIVAEAMILQTPLGPALIGFIYTALVGAGNLYSVRKTLQLAQMTMVAERERIARDLHDVLGHTLSVIILKSELAGRLIAQDAERAHAEIADVERISRKALAEVRDTIRGYRSGDLLAELERAHSMLKTAGVAVDARIDASDIAPEQERVLALALREAVTNVVRHAKANNCVLRLEKRDGLYQLDVQDDGQGGKHSEGLGMQGMRERVEALGGGVKQDGERGTRLVITLPVAVASGSSAV